MFIVALRCGNFKIFAEVGATSAGAFAALACATLTFRPWQTDPFPDRILSFLSRQPVAGKAPAGLDMPSDGSQVML